MCGQGQGYGAALKVFDVQFRRYLDSKGLIREDLGQEELVVEEAMVLQSSYPGAVDRPDRLVAAMLADNPDTVVEADIVAGDLPECEDEVQEEEGLATDGGNPWKPGPSYGHIQHFSLD